MISSGPKEPAQADVQLMQDLFDAALERPASQRAAFLEDACAGDAGLRARVARLLDCADRGADYLEQPPSALLQGDLPLGPGAGERIGPYELIRILASGGMGTVWLARRADEQFEKRVALKVIKRGMDTDALLARFRTERQVLATLEHPNIARLLDGGVTDDALPYLVMEYVDGQPIDQYCDANHLCIPARLELFCAACAAVQFAHQNLVVHRDLKPSNILVEAGPNARRHETGTGEAIDRNGGTPKLVDFGIAKLLRPDESDTTADVTAPQMRIMTPRYASPEQVRGEKITTASDVYSLGVVLYELLCGREPYESTPCTPRDYERAICNQQPQRPSLALGRRVAANDSSSSSRVQPLETVGALRNEEPRKLQRRLTGDLDMIVLRALHKEPHRRYATVEQFSDDIRRHLTHLPIVARPDSWVYRARKLVARNRMAVVAAGGVAVILIAAATVSLLFARSEAHQRSVALNNQRKAEAVTEFLVRAWRAQDPMETGRQDIRVSDAMQQAMAILDRGDMQGQPDTAAALMDAVSQILNHAGTSGRAEALAVRALELRRQLHAGDHVDVAASLNSLGHCHASLGRLPEALRSHEDALAMYQRLLPGDQELVAAAMNNVARCQRQLGRVAEALQLLEASLTMRQRLFPYDHREVAQSLNNLAGGLEACGRSEAALPMYQSALDMYKRLLPADHPSVAVSMNNLALCMQSLGRPGEALSIHGEALDMLQRLLGGDHPLVATNLSNVGLCLMALGQPDKALPNFEAALEMRLRLTPEDHPDVASGLGNVALCLGKLGRTPGALVKHTAALEMNQRLYQGDHASIARGLANVGSCHFEFGRYADALPRLQAAWEMRQRLFSDDHPDLAKSMGSLAGCHLALGDFKQALAHHQAALGMYSRLYKGDHPEIAKSLNGVGRCMRALGQAADALKMYQDALSMCRRLFSGDHPEIAMCLNSVALCLEALGRHADALPAFESALAMYQCLHAKDHPDVARCTKNVASCMQAVGRAGDALEKFESSLAMYRRLFDTDHPEIASARNSLGLCLNSMSRTADALAMYEAALSMNQRLFTRDHPEVANSLCNVAVALHALGRADESLPKIQAALDMRSRMLPAGHIDIDVARSYVGVVLVDLHRLAEAEPILLQAQAALAKSPGGTATRKQRCYTALVKLYEARHADHPDRGHDKEADKWRDRLAAVATRKPPASRR